MNDEDKAMVLESELLDAKRLIYLLLKELGNEFTVDHRDIVTLYDGLEIHRDLYHAKSVYRINPTANQMEPPATLGRADGCKEVNL